MVNECCFCDSDEFFESIVNEPSTDDFYGYLLNKSKDTKNCKPNERCMKSFYCTEDRVNDGRGHFDEEIATKKKSENECDDHEVCCDLSRSASSSGQSKSSVGTTRRPTMTTTRTTQTLIHKEYCQAGHECVNISLCEKQGSKLKSDTRKGACLEPNVCCEKLKDHNEILREKLCNEGRKLNRPNKCGVRNEGGVSNYKLKGPSTQFGEVNYIYYILHF